MISLCLFLFVIKYLEFFFPRCIRIFYLQKDLLVYLQGRVLGREIPSAGSLCLCRQSQNWEARGRQEPGIPSWSATWVAGAQVLELSSAWAHWHKAGSTVWRSQDSVQGQKHPQLRPNKLYHFLPFLLCFFHTKI